MKFRIADCGLRIGAPGRRPVLQCAVLLLGAFSFFMHSASAESVLLEHAIIHTASGTVITNGSVSIENGKITGVMDASRPVARDFTASQRIDLKGQHLYPGLIALNSTLGLTEIEAVRATRDDREVGDYTPDVESWISINTDSELIPVARANGIAYFEPAPSGNIISGQSGLL